MIQLKIGFFTDTYAQVNGVTVTIKALEKNLRDLGHEVYVYAPRGEAGEAKGNPHLFTSEGFRFILSPEYRWAVFPVFTIPQSNLGLDIIHVHSPISMGLAGLVNARRLRIPCIGSVHTLIPEFWKPFLQKHLPYITPPVLDRVINRFLKPLVDKFSILDTTLDLGTFFMEELTWRYFVEFFKRCNETIVPSKYTQEECQKHRLKSTVLPNGIDFQKFQQMEDEKTFSKRWNIAPKDIVALYVGRLSEEKNIDLILESARDVLKNFPTLKYMIVGDGPLRSKLEKLTEKNAISDSIIFTGYLNQESLNRCLSRADFFINASPLETQGLSVIEAMYFGCPILSVNSGAVVELFENSSFGILFKNSKKDLTAKVQELLENRNLLSKFRKNAKLKAREYDIKKFCKRLIAIYEKYL